MTLLTRCAWKLIAKFDLIRGKTSSVIKAKNKKLCYVKQICRLAAATLTACALTAGQHEQQAARPYELRKAFNSEKRLFRDLRTKEQPQLPVIMNFTAR